MTTGPIAVLGATGTQGGATARRLLADGAPVRALVRDPQSPRARRLAEDGASLVVAELEDQDSLVTAFRDAAGVFAVPPRGDTAARAADARAVATAAGAAGVAHLVFSGVGSLSGDTTGIDAVEAGLGGRVPTLTVLRPVRFYSNFLITGGRLDGIVDGVNRHVFTPDRPAQLVAVEDLAWFAAAAFADPGRYGGRTLEVAGDDPTPDAAADLIATTTGLDVRYEQLDAARADDLGPDVAAFRARWESGRTWHADIEALRVLHPGLRTLTGWLAAGGAERLLARHRSVSSAS